jgi:hypothetical protein
MRDVLQPPVIEKRSPLRRAFRRRLEPFADPLDNRAAVP